VIIAYLNALRINVFIAVIWSETQLPRLTSVLDQTLVLKLVWTSVLAKDKVTRMRLENPAELSPLRCRVRTSGSQCTLFDPPASHPRGRCRERPHTKCRLIDECPSGGQPRCSWFSTEDGSPPLGRVIVRARDWLSTGWLGLVTITTTTFARALAVMSGCGLVVNASCVDFRSAACLCLCLWTTRVKVNNTDDYKSSAKSTVWSLICGICVCVLTTDWLGLR